MERKKKGRASWVVKEYLYIILIHVELACIVVKENLDIIVEERLLQKKLPHPYSKNTHSFTKNLLLYQNNSFTKNTHSFTKNTHSFTKTPTPLPKTPTPLPKNSNAQKKM